ncbi:MAG: hypothetical protein P1P84_11395 [Deferrisomatales bacterium]|nr:hypothetical protein [Deferrisomatales bacterium]
MERRVVPLLMYLLLATTGWAMGSNGAVPERAARTSMQLIAAAVEAGEIDADTAVEYQVYSVKADDKLPERYRGGRPMKDATGVLRQARARYPELRSDVQERLRPYLYPEGR